MLVLGRSIDDGADECIRRRVAVAFAAGADKAGACGGHGAVDKRRDYDITRNAITPGDDEDPGPVLANCRQGLAQPRTFSDRRNTAHALVGAPRCHSDALARGPRFDARALGVPREALLVFGRAEVGDGGAAGSAEGMLRHAKYPAFP